MSQAISTVQIVEQNIFKKEDGNMKDKNTVIFLIIIIEFFIMTLIFASGSWI